MFGCQDQDTVGGGVDQGVQALFFVDALAVELRVEDGDGGLVRKGLQQLFVVGREQIGIGAEDEDDADDVPVRDQRQGRAVDQPQAGGVGQVLEHAVELGHVQLRHGFL